MSEQALLYILKSCMRDIESLQDCIFGCTLRMYGDHSLHDTMTQLNSLDMADMASLLNTIETKRSILNSMYGEIQASISPDVSSIDSNSNSNDHLHQSESTNSLLFPMEDVL